MNERENQAAMPKDIFYWIDWYFSKHSIHYDEQKGREKIKELVQTTARAMAADMVRARDEKIKIKCLAINNDLKWVGEEPQESISHIAGSINDIFLILSETPADGEEVKYCSDCAKEITKNDYCKNVCNECRISESI